jgi:hypothetical protein
MCSMAVLEVFLKVDLYIRTRVRRTRKQEITAAMVSRSKKETRAIPQAVIHSGFVPGNTLFYAEHPFHWLNFFCTQIFQPRAQ